MCVGDWANKVCAQMRPDAVPETTQVNEGSVEVDQSGLTGEMGSGILKSILPPSLCPGPRR